MLPVPSGECQAAEHELGPVEAVVLYPRRHGERFGIIDDLGMKREQHCIGKRTAAAATVRKRMTDILP